MGNSTVKLRDIVDSTSAIAELQPIFTATGGFAAEPAISIANAVMEDLIAQRFNHKWNRLRIPAIALSTNQQDYPSVSLSTLGWLESAAVIDQSNTSFPKPTWPVETVRDLPISDIAAGRPGQVCTLPNSLLEYGSWPGPITIYVDPMTAAAGYLANQPTAFMDANGNILSLLQFGMTGLQAPFLPAASAAGLTVADGTCVWQVCDPNATGFRVEPRPSPGGVLWLLRLFGQLKPVRFTTLNQTLAPIPDDYAGTFQTGFIAFAHRYSSNPALQARWMPMRQEWQQTMLAAAKQGDREPTSFGFVPDRPIMDSGWGFGLNAGNPYPTRRRN